jgi:hypothetical protein
MTETPMKLVVDCKTGESSYIPFTQEEIEQHEKDLISFEERMVARQAEEQNQEALKASANNKLKALGLTDEEIAAITK